MKPLFLAAILLTNFLQAQPGTLDAGFSGDGKLTLSPTGQNASARSVTVQPDGRIIAAGTARQDGSQNDFALARFHPDGSPDLGFNASGKTMLDFFGLDDFCSAMVLQPDHKILVAGYTFTGEGFEFAMARLHPDGSPDLDFGTGGRVSAQVGTTGFCQAAALQPDGKILLGGYALSADASTNEFVVLRFHPDGTPDLDFGTNGQSANGVGPGASVANAMVVQPDGKIVLAGQTANDATLRWESALLRLRADGTRDTEFGVNGAVITVLSGLDSNIKSIALQSDGQITVAGYAGSSPSNNRFMLARYLANGTPDPDFADNGLLLSAAGPQNNYAQAVVISPSRIIAGGSLHQNGQDFFAVAAYHFDGSKDLSFGTGGTAMVASGLFDGIAALALDADGKIVTAGSTVIDNASHFALARFEGASALGRRELEFGKDFWVAPNPVGAGSKLHFSLDRPDTVWIGLLDASGRKVTSVLDGKACGAGVHEIPLSAAENLSRGLYQLVFKSQSGSVALKLVR